MMTNSSDNSRRRILGTISRGRAERLLVEWLNTDLGDTPEDANAWERLFRRYPEILSVPAHEVLPCTEQNFERFHQQMEMASSVGADLARAWEATELRRFEWYTWKAQMQYEYEAAIAKHNVTHLEVDEVNLPGFTAALIESDEPPTIVTPVEAAIFHLRHNRRRALCCPNPDCPAPYFLASKKGQKFCSPECAKPSQRESKRRWWAENRAKGRSNPKLSKRRGK